jgi:hypothetical protein
LRRRGAGGASAGNHTREKQAGRQTAEEAVHKKTPLKLLVRLTCCLRGCLYDQQARVAITVSRHEAG